MVGLRSSSHVWYKKLPYGRLFYHHQGYLTALNDYVTNILGSKANVRVLKTLLHHRGKVFTIRELARTAGLSHPEVSRVVKELEKRGIAKLQPVGRAQQISLNEESYVLKSMIEPLFRAEKNTVNSLISTIKPFFRDSRIVSVAIFGSMVRGLERNTSDIDLLVIAKDREVANECVARASSAAFSRFGIAMSPFIIEEERFIREHDRELEKSILESYILSYGKDPKEIIEGGKAGRQKARFGVQRRAGAGSHSPL